MPSRSYLAVLGAAAVSYAALGSVLRLLPEIVPDHATLGLMVGAPALTAVLTRPLGGAAADRVGPPRVMSGGAVLMAIGVAPALVSDSTSALLSSRLMVGAGEGAMMAACVLWLLRLAGPERRGQALGHIGLANYAGLTIGPLIAAALGAERVPVLVVAAVLPLVGAALSHCARCPDRDGARPSSGPRASAGRAVLGPGVGLMLVNFGYVALLAFGPQVGGSELIVPVFAGGVILVRTLGASLPDRLGARPTVLGSTLVAACGLVVLAVSSSEVVAVAGTGVLAVGQALAVPALGMLALAGVPPERQGAAAGLFFAFFDAGVGGGGPVVGVAARLTSPAGALVVGAVAVAAAGVVALVAGRRSVPA